MSALHPLVARLKPSEQQLPAITARGGDVVVTAGAGTGKTRTLVARTLALLADGLPLRRIVAVTFTRKAAREMRNRLRRELDDYLIQVDLAPQERSFWEEQIAALDAARIGTIHQLCADILRSHPAEADVDPRFAVLEESAALLFKREAVDAAMAWAADDEAGARLFRLLGEGRLRSILEQLLGDRLGAADSLAALPHREQAGKPAGKPANETADETAAILKHWRTVLARRQEEALEALFEDASWREAVATLRGSVPLDTGDKMAGQRALALAALDAAAGTISAHRASALAPLDAINLQGGRQATWSAGKAELDEVKAALRQLRDMWRGAETLRLALNPLDEALAGALPGLVKAFTIAREHYLAARERLQALDFDDLEARALALLQNHKTVRRYWQEDVVGALLVDEFQDTNERQRRLVRLLTGDAGKLFIVGDAKQSIYRFRGADVTVFRDERVGIQQRGGRAFGLDVCYRSHPALIRAMNDLLAPVLGTAEEADRPWQEPFAALTWPERGAKAAVGAAPYVEMHLTAGSKGDGSLRRAAQAVAVRLLALQAAGELQEFGDVAILCRASTAFGPYEDALDAAGIPFVTVAGRGFYGRPEIRETLNALAAIADPADDLALAGLLRSPGLGLTDAALYRLVQARQPGRSLWQTLSDAPGAAGAESDRAARARRLIEGWHRLAGRAPVADVLKRYLDDTAARAALRQSGQARAARNLAKLVSDAHGSGLVGVEAFLLYVAELRDAGAREGEARATGAGAVQIMTIHAAKGLEFPVVILGDAAYGGRTRYDALLDPELGPLLPLRDEDGTLAASYQLGQAREASQEEAEANRLLYVACTRAEQRLIVSGHASRLKSDGTLSTSGWLGQLTAVVGLDQVAFPDYRDDGDGRHSLTCRAGESAIAIHLYEPAWVPGLSARIAASSATPSTLTPPPPLLGRLETEMEPTVRDPERVWQIVPASPRATAPAWLIGKVVHEALAAWRFRGTSTPEWFAARCRHYGLSDERQIHAAVREIARLLDRFQNHALFREMDRAEQRLHELPFSRMAEGKPDQGQIDCLYRQDGQLTIVDFKTDRLARHEHPTQHAARENYLKQVQRYRTAVEALLGETPRALLCWLDAGGEIFVDTIDG